ncbi:MAG: 16S rRNA (guanine(527)-N(7))-methyltransferase RsmG [Bacteroidota bacterium]|nr:16S rRNA (guanine(527)-N(7))-methyltransferase RsmG [Bacteroidota bacterium]
MNQITHYFPHLSGNQINAFEQMKPLYEYWNARINVISRKDMDSFYLHHVLHSLSIVKFVRFSKGAKVIDIGCGGGFPGIPLAIMFPEVQFFMLDSIRKKIKVITEVKQALSLDNVEVIHARSEEHKGVYHYMTARAVTRLPEFVSMTKHLLKYHQKFQHQGLYYLKGGDLQDELKLFRKYKMWELSDVFNAPFFETKKLVHLPLYFNRA